MATPIYIEDIFIQFFVTINTQAMPMWGQDKSAAFSFYESLIQNKPMTQNQRSYIIKLLHKYRNVLQPYYDYADLLEPPLWKNPIRVVDHSKKVWVEQDDNRKIWACFRFPFSLKEKFDTEIVTNEGFFTHNSSIWDRERRIRKLAIYDYNLIHIYEFCKEHGFELDETFMEALSSVEEIWQNTNYYTKKSEVVDGTVKLINAPEDAANFFESKKANKLTSDLILAKNMGYRYIGTPTNMFETIAHNESNKFFAKDIEQFLQLSYGVDGKVVLILERGDETAQWIKYLADKIDELGYSKTDFRVCFRSSNKDNPEFNKWVNETGFGGKISDAKFLIFQQKPAKWLFKNENDVIIVATNELLPGMNSTARAMFSNHPCVVFIGEFKPVKHYKENIVEL